MNLLRLDLRPRDIVTRKAIENAAMVVAATGGSTNGALHLPAIASEAGIDFDIHAFGKICQAHALHRRLQAGREIRDERSAPHRRRAGDPQGAARWRLSARRLPDRHRQDHGREPERRRRAQEPGRGASDREAAVAHRRADGAQGQSRAARLDLQGRGHAGHPAQVPRPGALLRPRGGLLRRGRGRQIQEGRRAGDPLRRPARRPGHARDAVHHRRALRPGRGQRRGAHHRRALLRRHARLLHRACRPGSGGRRADRPAARTAT